MTITSSHVNSIDETFFLNCDKLKTVEITVTEVLDTITFGSELFSTCTALETVKIKAIQVVISNDLFSRNSHLIEFDYEGTGINFGKNVFANTKLQILNVNSPTSTFTFKEGTFDNCEELTTVHLTTKDLHLENNLFKNKAKLNDLVIVAQQVSFGDYCFFGCSLLTKIEMNSYINIIGKHCFQNTSLTSFKNKLNVILIDEWAFAGLYTLKEFICEQTIKTINVRQ